MKKKFILIFLQIVFYMTAYTQIKYPGSFEDDCVPRTKSTLKSAATKYSPNGMAFTPKGDFKVLIVCVGFGTPYDNYPLDGWASGTNTLPDWANDKRTFYNNNSDFTDPVTANDKNNVSRFYYEMSKGAFRLTADVYPTRVNIDPTGSTSFADFNRKVIAKMKADNPNFDLSKYDKRKNSPNFSSDNSISSSDSVIDYVVIAFRYQREVNDKNSLWYKAPPVAKMYNWSYSGGGVASLLSLSSYKYGGYSFNDSCGYTQSLGASNMYGLFLHEVAHTLFDCPHYANANGVHGDYFYTQMGAWGMMNLGSGSFGCSNGWERWYLGWTELTSNFVNSDVRSSSDLPYYGEFTLRDFITTGDVVRIKIPNGTGINQYLWLENHQGLSIYDNRGWTADSCGTFPSSPRGLVAYIESIDGDRNAPFDFLLNTYTANGIKPLHSKGNYDYSYSGTPSTQCLWRNPVYNMIEGVANPLSGQNRIEGIRAEFYIDNNNDIYINTDVNNPKPVNEYHWVAKRNNNMTYDFMGSDLNFSIGQSIGMTTNPALINRPIYSISTMQMSPYYLNGISVNVYSQASNGDIKVRISYNNVAVNSDVRWTGNIVLPDITGDSSPDLNLYPNYTLTINKSGTPNCHNKTIFGDFINPSIFTCDQNSTFKMQSNSKTIVDNYSRLVLNPYSTFEINDGALLTIKSNSTFIIRKGANINVKGSGRVEIESGAYICIETGANINLQDYLSAINLHTGYQTGGNPAFYSPSSRCSSTPLNFVTTGNGSINGFNGNNYIQNQTFTVNDFLTGFNIFAGTNVTAAKPQGLVIIQSGANVVFDADGEILLDKGFEVQSGATFEAK
jgi:M6 family metalloprotease-like protein